MAESGQCLCTAHSDRTAAQCGLPMLPCSLETHTQGASFIGCTASHLAGSFLQHTYSEHLPCTSGHSGKCWTHRPQWKRQKLQAAPRKALQSFPLTTENTLSVLLRFFTFWKRAWLSSLRAPQTNSWQNLPLSRGLLCVSSAWHLQPGLYSGGFGFMCIRM